MRSLLFVPAANLKALAKSNTLAPDAFIYDLEDSSVASEKATARSQLEKHLSDFDGANRTILIRINAADTDHYELDLELITKPEISSKIDGVVLPKVDNAAQITALDNQLDGFGLKLWAMIETPLGVLNAEKIAAASPNLAGFIVGLEDLSARLGISVDAQRNNVSFALQKIVLAAKAFDMHAIDSVCKSYQDEAAMLSQSEQAVALGFSGKSLIHPNQIDTANTVFGVSDQALDAAHKLIDAFEAALAEGKSVATLDGKLVEELHFEAAKALVLKHRSYGH